MCVCVYFFFIRKLKQCSSFITFLFQCINEHPVARAHELHCICSRICNVHLNRLMYENTRIRSPQKRKRKKKNSLCMAIINLCSALAVAIVIKKNWGKNVHITKNCFQHIVPFKQTLKRIRIRLQAFKSCINSDSIYCEINNASLLLLVHRAIYADIARTTRFYLHLKYFAIGHVSLQPSIFSASTFFFPRSFQFYQQADSFVWFPTRMYNTTEFSFVTAHAQQTVLFYVFSFSVL